MKNVRSGYEYEVNYEKKPPVFDRSKEVLH